MKKIFLSLLFVVLLVVSYGIYNELSYSPLKKRDFDKLFKGYAGPVVKSCSKDLIGWSIHGQIFDIYMYQTKGAVIDKEFPLISDKWDARQITKECAIGKWKNCPIDSHTNELYNSTFTTETPDKFKYMDIFKNEMLNPKNFYSYIFFHEWDQYFLVYCTDTEELFYMRKKGI